MGSRAFSSDKSKHNTNILNIQEKLPQHTYPQTSILRELQVTQGTMAKRAHGLWRLQGSESSFSGSTERLNFSLEGSSMLVAAESSRIG